MRQQATAKFGLYNNDKPFFVGRFLEAWTLDDISKFNRLLGPFINSSVLRFVADPPYSHTTLPEVEPVPYVAIRDGHTSEAYVRPEGI